MKKKPVQLWVDPDFKKGVKVFAARENCSIMEATKKISESINIKEDKDETFKKIRPKYRI